MQESLDDYLKLSQNFKSEEPSTDIRKEYQITVQKKRECDARALKIVEFSVEGKLRPEIFTKCLPYLNQSHYQDIVEERAVTKLCGYSICGKRIPDMPKKQYYISTKNNKVYDITDRKNFCSNFCYKASVHIKKQIDDSPLWLRKLDDIPEYQFLGSDESGLPGELIDQGISKTVAESSFMSVGNFTQASLTDMINTGKERPKELKKEKPQAKHKSKLVKTMQTITENTEQNEEEDEVRPSHMEHRGLRKSASLPVIIENEENIETKCESCENLTLTLDVSIKSETKTKRIKKKNSKSIKANPDDILRKVFKDWLTLDSLIFLYGENKVKEILSSRKLSDCFEKLNISKLERDQQVKYMDICRRLHLREMADEKFDSAVLGDSLKPLPDYNKLKRESKELNLKVKCFYSGVLQEKEDSNFPAKVNKSDESKDEESEDTPVLLPLVDVNSQKALRRKIFLHAISKSMQQLLQVLRVKFFSTVLSDLQALVKTFNLSADNIVFKPAIWNYICVILLNILAVRDSNIRNVLEGKCSQEYVKLQFSILPNREGIISEIMKDVCDVEMFIENYISSN